MWNVREIKSINHHIEFIVYKFSDIYDKIIPFFTKHSLVTSKLLDYNDFSKIAYFIKNKEHLTSEGIKNIDLLNEVQSKLNKYRIFN